MSAIFRLIRKLYDWVLHWAETPYGVPAHSILSFTESSFFPVPPDVLLIALGISIPKRSFRYALYCSASSVLGGCLGYLIGVVLMQEIGWPIIDFYDLRPQFEHVTGLFRENSFIAVLIAALTPIPYKVFTIAAGASRADFFLFLLASAIGRSCRFFALSTLIYIFGAPVKAFIDKYFNLLTVIFTILLVGGFIVIKWFMH